MISDQLYCEALLDFRIKNNGYENVEPGEARRIAQEVIRKLRLEGKKRLVRFPIAGKVKGLYFVMSPDAMIVEKGKVKAIVRVRLRKSLRIYESDFSLLYIMGLVLNEQRLLAENAILLVIISNDPDSLKRSLDSLANLANKEVNFAEAIKTLDENSKAAYRLYDREAALALLEKIIGYWKGERAPIALPSERKCSSCPFRNLCPYKHF